MLTIALILPGATDFDVQGRIRGKLNVPLNPEGLQEVARLSDELRSCHLEVIYSADGQPSLETAEALAEALDVKLKRLDKITNIDYGLWQGMLVDDVRLKQPKVYRQWQDQPESICPPEGETLAEVRQRVQDVVGRLVKKHKQGTIGVVFPEPLASLLRVQLGCGELGDLWRAGADHGRWQLIQVEPATVAS
jgi:probable phosphoglycerate mutase